MRLAHVRDSHAPAGAGWRLVAALDDLALHWVDLELARRRAITSRPALAHDAVLFRQPVSTLDDHLARGLRVATLAELTEGFMPRGGPSEDEAVLDVADLRFGPPVLRPPAFRDFYAFERHVRTMWERRGGEIPEAWYRLPIFYFSNVSELRGPGDPVWAPRGSDELDYELEVGAVIDTPVRDLMAERGEEAIGGYCVVNDWSARDLQRDESAVRLGPAKGKDFAISIGPWLVTPDELADARRPGSSGPDLAMTATVHTPDGTGPRSVETSRDLQRDESAVRLGPAKGKDFAISIGPWLVTPDELADARRPGSSGPDLAMTATVHTPDGTGPRSVETSRGIWSSARFSFGQMIERASADVGLRPGEIFGSGTVGGGSLLEIREGTLGRYLEPGDEVELEIERLGVLRSPVVARPG